MPLNLYNANVTFNFDFFKKIIYKNNFDLTLRNYFLHPLSTCMFGMALLHISGPYCLRMQLVLRFLPKSSSFPFLMRGIVDNPDCLNSNKY